MKIGVFDSGKGGLSVYLRLKRAFKNHQFIFLNDHKNLPYGSKTKEQLLKLTKPYFDEFKKQDCQIVVVACNTVSMTIFEDLKKKYPYTLIPTIPMIDEANNLSKTKKVVVCATPATLTSQKYTKLKNHFSQLNYFEPDCSQWALMIENNQVDKLQIKNSIKPAIDNNYDVVVLACTHYHWIEQDIRKICSGKAQVIQPEEKLIQALRQLL